MNKGILVSLEGVNGSGKTTLAKQLAQELRSDGYRVGTLKFPGPNCEIVEMIVKEGLTGDLAFLGMLQHFELYERIIRLRLEYNQVIILDRYYHSALVMQKPSKFMINSRLASALKKGTILEPDLTFVLPMREIEISSGDGFENYESQSKACIGFLELEGGNIIHLEEHNELKQLISCKAAITKIIRKPELPNKNHKTKGNISL